MVSTTGWKAYAYNPSMAAAAIFTILFAVTTIFHTYQMFSKRTWFFIPMIIGGYFETIGYVGRAMSAQQSPNWEKGPYIIQSTLLLIAPALFAASIYMELGRIIRLVRGERFAIVRVNWLTKIFVGGDVLSFLMQASGAGLMVTAASGSSSDSADSAKMGNNIIIGGLFVQIIFFGFFLVSAIVFQRRLGSQSGYAVTISHLPWRKHMFALHVTSMLILVRSVVRVVEYVQGDDGYVMTHEAFIYLFDGLLMWIMLVIFAVVHPGEIGALLKREQLKMGRSYGLDGAEPLV